MLRIEFHEHQETVTLKAEGRFVGRYAEDIKQMVLRCTHARRLEVNLSEVTFVDSAGEDVLLWLAHVGGRFVTETSYSRDVCERLQLPIIRRANVAPHGDLKMSEHVVK